MEISSKREDCVRASPLSPPSPSIEQACKAWKWYTISIQEAVSSFNCSHRLLIRFHNILFNWRSGHYSYISTTTWGTTSEFFRQRFFNSMVWMLITCHWLRTDVFKYWTFTVSCIFHSTNICLHVHVARTDDIRNAFKLTIGKPMLKDYLLEKRGADGMDPTEIGIKGTNWIQLVWT